MVRVYDLTDPMICGGVSMERFIWSLGSYLNHHQKKIYVRGCRDGEHYNDPLAYSDRIPLLFSVRRYRSFCRHCSLRMTYEFSVFEYIQGAT